MPAGEILQALFLFGYSVFVSRSVLGDVKELDFSAYNREEY